MASVSTSTLPSQDEGWTLYWSLYLLGFGSMTPWSALVSSVDYFEEVYPDWNPIRWITVLCFGASTLSLGLQLWKPSLCGKEPQILIGFILFTLILILIPTLEWWLIGEGKGTVLSFGLLLCWTTLIGVIAAVVEGAVLGVTLILPSEYPQACVSGGGFAGFFVSLLRLFTKASFSDSSNAVRFSAFMFFWISALICFICVLTCWLIVIPHPMISYYKQENFESSEDDVSLINTISEAKTNLQVVKKLTPSLLLLLLIFTVSFAIYPGITEDVECAVFGDWYSVILVTLFTAFDVIGKSTPSKLLNWNLCWIIYIASIRSLLIPVFALIINRFPNPLLIISLLALTAASGGNLNVAVFVIGQKELLSYHESLIGSAALLLSVFLGTNLGSTLSLIWTKST